MANIPSINMEMFNDNKLINSLSSAQLKELATLSVNVEQINKVIQAQNMDHEVLTAILANNKVSLEKLEDDSFIKLIKNSLNIQELKKIFGVINAINNRRNESN